MKTLADLKRDANSGKMYMLMIERYGSTDIIDRLKGVRPVLRANTVSVTLRNQTGEESEMRFQNAALTEYTGDTLTIYNAGERDLTPEEKAVLNQAEAEKERYKKENPYSESYWHMKQFFKNCPFPYLAGNETVKGKKYQYNGKIQDNQIKGNAILKYKIVFADSMEEAEMLFNPEPVQMTLADYMTV